VIKMERSCPFIESLCASRCIFYLENDLGDEDCLIRLFLMKEVIKDVENSLEARM